MSKPAMRLVDATSPPRTPERESLAEAIARHGAATKQLVRIAAAHERASETVFDSNDSVDRATAALDEAKVGEGSYLTAVALGEADAAASPVKTAAANVEQANEQLATARRTRDALEAEIKTAENNLMWAKNKINDVVGAAVKTDPATAQLVAEFNAAELQYFSLKQQMGIVRTDRMPDEAKFWYCEHNWPESPGVAKWRAALAALASDADALLPTS